MKKRQKGGGMLNSDYQCQREDSTRYGDGFHQCLGRTGPPSAISVR